MLNNEQGRQINQLGWIWNIFLGAVSGSVQSFLYQRLVWSIVIDVIQVIYKQWENVKINHPRSTRLINKEKIKQQGEKTT